MDAPGNNIDVGGTEGGFGTFLAGVALALVSAWFFVDSVRVRSGGYGIFSSALGGTTGSAGVVFLPLFVGIVGLFVDARKRWPWIVFAIGVAVLAIEIVSRLTFWFDFKLSHLLIMIGGFAAGLGMIIRSLRAMPPLPR